MGLKNLLKALALSVGLSMSSPKRTFDAKPVRLIKAVVAVVKKPIEGRSAAERDIKKQIAEKLGVSPLRFEVNWYQWESASPGKKVDVVVEYEEM